jgi:micrococcal nuclease
LAVWVWLVALAACSPSPTTATQLSTTEPITPSTSAGSAVTSSSTTITVRPSTTVTSLTTITHPPAAPTTTEVPAGVAPLLPDLDGDPPPGAEITPVIAIVDGDTIRVRRAGGVVEPVRLIGVNSPEQDECMAEEAADFLAPLLDSPVGLTSDQSDRDQFDRLLRYVWWGSDSVNELLVRSGLAIARRYAPDLAMADVFDAAQEQAQQRAVGIWAPDACGPEPTARLEIIEVEYDPAGNDNFDLNGEWVRIENPADVPAALAGWTIKDESASHRYHFPVGFTLLPGEAVTVHTGCGTDFGLDLYWCNRGSAVWNNEGDTAFLLDPSGNIIDAYSYSR